MEKERSGVDDKKGIVESFEGSGNGLNNDYKFVIKFKLDGSGIGMFIVIEYGLNEEVVDGKIFYD